MRKYLTIISLFAFVACQNDKKTLVTENKEELIKKDSLPRIFHDRRKYLNALTDDTSNINIYHNSMNWWVGLRYNRNDNIEINIIYSKDSFIEQNTIFGKEFSLCIIDGLKLEKYFEFGEKQLKKMIKDDECDKVYEYIEYSFDFFRSRYKSILYFPTDPKYKKIPLIGNKPYLPGKELTRGQMDSILKKWHHPRVDSVEVWTKRYKEGHPNQKL